MNLKQIQTGIALIFLLISATAPGFAQQTDHGEMYLPSESSGQADITPTIQDMVWSVEDTTVELLINFNTIPVRYSAYALQNPDRVVLDCFGTVTIAGIDDRGLPAPVTHVEFGTENMGDEQLRLVRLVLFTSKAVGYHITETPARLRLVLDYNTRLESQSHTQTKKRRWLWGSLITGTGLAAAAGIAAVVLTAGDENGPPAVVPAGDIPAPDMPTPDGN